MNAPDFWKSRAEGKPRVLRTAAMAALICTTYKLVNELFYAIELRNVPAE